MPSCHKCCNNEAVATRLQQTRVCGRVRATNVHASSLLLLLLLSWNNKKHTYARVWTTHVVTATTAKQIAVKTVTAHSHITRKRFLLIFLSPRFFVVSIVRLRACDTKFGWLAYVYTCCGNHNKCCFYHKLYFSTFYFGSNVNSATLKSNKTSRNDLLPHGFAHSYVFMCVCGMYAVAPCSILRVYSLLNVTVCVRH